MTKSLTAVIARWPHTQTSYPFQTGGCATVRTGHLPEHCHRCQMERWRDEWMRRAKSISTGEIGYEFRSDVLGSKEGE